jgi:hypothetical protein
LKTFVGVVVNGSASHPSGPSFPRASLTQRTSLSGSSWKTSSAVRLSTFFAIAAVGFSATSAIFRHTAGSVYDAAPVRPAPVVITRSTVSPCCSSQYSPVNWRISTERKRGFFEKVREITGAD